MAFPASLPSYNATAGSDTLNTAGSGTGLSGLLNAMEVDITALGTKVGTGATTPASNTLLFGTGAGTSAWQTLTSAQLASTVSDETGSGSLVFANTPTIVTPTIASFTNAQHNHANAAGGGTLSITPSMLATGATTAFVATAEATSSTSFVDLTTTTDTVTVTIGTNGLALITLSAVLAGNTAGMVSYMGVTISGASTVAASDAKAYQVGAVGGLTTGQQSFTYLETGLTTGSTTFKAKYHVSSGATAVTASNRRITVIPL